MHDWNDAEVLVSQAGASFAAGRYAEAESALRQALRVIPDEPEWLFNLGLTLEMLGRPLEAAIAFARSFRHQDHDQAPDEDGPDVPSFLTEAEPGADPAGNSPPPPPTSICAHRVGVNLLAHGEPRRAARWFRRAVRLDRSAPEAHTGLIAALGEQGLAAEAETAFFEAQQDIEEDPRIYVAIAGVLMNSGKRERAIWCLREASRLDPSLPHVRRNLASIFVQTNRFERARQLYLAELRQDPGDIATLIELGGLLLKMNRADEAAEKFRRVLELVPDHPDGHYALADLAERTGDHAGALRGFEVLSRLSPDHSDVRRRLAGLLLQRAGPRDLAAARDLLRRERAALRRSPSEVALDDVHQLAVLMIRADLCGEATPLLEQIASHLTDAITEEAGDPVVRPHASQAASTAHVQSDARARHGARGSVASRAALAHHHLSVARFELGDIEHAMESARNAIRLDPRLTPAMHNLALGHMREGQWDRARHWTRRAAAIDPDDPTIARLSTRLRLRVLIGLWRLATGVFRRSR